MGVGGGVGLLNRVPHLAVERRDAVITIKRMHCSPVT